MAKRTPITDAELAELRERALDLASDIHDANERIRRDIGYADDVATPAQYAASFNGLAISAAELSQAISHRIGAGEERAKLMAELSKR